MKILFPLIEIIDPVSLTSWLSPISHKLALSNLSQIRSLLPLYPEEYLCLCLIEQYGVTVSHVH